MTSQKKSWRIRGVANSAVKNLHKLDLKTQEALLIKMECLEFDPFLGDIKKIQGKNDIYRLRVDDQRVYFRLCQTDKTIEILVIDNRSGIKGKKIQRL